MPFLCPRCEDARCRGVRGFGKRRSDEFGGAESPEPLKKGELGFPGGFTSYSRLQQSRNPLSRASLLLHRAEGRLLAAAAPPASRSGDGSLAGGLPLLRSSADSKFKGRNGARRFLPAAASLPPTRF